MRFVFSTIPMESTFAVFDLKNSKVNKKTWKIPVGDSNFEYELPDEWVEPYQNLRSRNYWIPNAYIPIEKQKSEIVITGENYYIDVNREKIPEELNQESVESLIYNIHGNEQIKERQQFFIALVSLQSYFEYLVYGMLVLSGFKTKTQFNNLKTHKERTKVAFSTDNTHFFSNQIEICPGKSNLGQLMPTANRAEINKILDTIRTMRNKVVHSWGFKDLSKENIKHHFEQLGEDISLHTSENEFYKNAAFVFVRLYARVNYIKNQLSYFHEKEMVRLEREERGY